jgi:hypothetical protein
MGLFKNECRPVKTEHPEQTIHNLPRCPPSRLRLTRKDSVLVRVLPTVVLRCWTGVRRTPSDGGDRCVTLSDLVSVSFIDGSNDVVYDKKIKRDLLRIVVYYESKKEEVKIRLMNEGH